MLPKLQWSDGKPVLTPQWEDGLHAELTEIRALALGETPKPPVKPSQNPQKIGDATVDKLAGTHDMSHAAPPTAEK